MTCARDERGRVRRRYDHRPETRQGTHTHPRHDIPSRLLKILVLPVQVNLGLEPRGDAPHAEGEPDEAVAEERAEAGEVAACVRACPGRMARVEQDASRVRDRGVGSVGTHLTDAAAAWKSMNLRRRKTARRRTHLSKWSVVSDGDMSNFKLAGLCFSSARHIT